MRVTTDILVGMLLLALVSGGCATSRLGNPFAAAARSGREANRRAESSLADRDTRSRWETDDAADDSRVNRRNGGTGNSIASSRKSAVAAKQEASTRALIDEELRDVPAEERQRLLADMKDMHPDMVRQFLRVYKMGQRAQRQQVEVAQLQRTNEFRDRLAQAGGAEGPEQADGRGMTRNGPSAGLGNASAWGHTSNYNARDNNNSNLNSNTSKPGEATGHVTLRDVHTVNVQPAGATDPQNSVVHANVRDQNDVDSKAVIAAGHDSSQPNHRNGSAAPDSRNTAASRFDRPAGGPDGSKAGLLGLGSLIPGVYNTAKKGVGQTSSASVSGNAQRADYNVNSNAGPSASSMQPVAVRSPGEVSASQSDNPWPVQLQLAIAAAEREVSFAPPGANDAEKHAYLEKHVYLRMLYLMAGQQERALQAIPGIDAADQEFWQQTFWGLANYFDASAIPAPEARATQTVSQLTTALLRLQEKAQLELRNVTFCHKIASFGNYERFPRDEFSPGQEVLLYAEVGNIHSESTTDGRFRTLLKSTLEIYQPGPQGTRVEQIELPAPATEDVCRTHRRDYFHSYQFAIPPKLASGPYVLKLTVEDQLSRRVVSYSLNFTVK